MIALNAILIEHLAISLNEKLKDDSLLNCFSSSKDDFYFQTTSYCIQVHFYQHIPFFLFPENVHLPRKNVLSFLKNSLSGDKLEVVVIPLERGIIIRLGQQKLVFKLFGKQSDILLFEEDICVKSFRKNALILNKSLSEIFKFNIGMDYILSNADGNSIKKKVPYLPESLIEWSRENNYFNGWNAGTVYLSIFNKTKGAYYVSTKGIPELRFDKFNDSIEYTDVTKALHAYSSAFLSYVRFSDRKEQLLQKNIQILHQLEKKQASSIKQLNFNRNKTNYSHLADILMANLHWVEKGMKEVVLVNFYNGKEERIQLKPELNAQQNASRYYQKGKKEHVQIFYQEKQLEEIKAQIITIKNVIELIRKASEFVQLPLDSTSETFTKPVKKRLFVYHVNSYEIWVGRSALDNDELLRLAHKNDLWLHAKDVKGSHVIVRCGKTLYPDEYVLEKAASLASYYSEARGSSLAPVIVTERKYVRKKKGMANGAVIVEKEHLIMAEPKDFSSFND